jgi:broad specificity phosphatase PhoE
VKRLFLIRHGVTQWNQEKRLQGHCDVPLGREGAKDALAAAAVLRKVGATSSCLLSSDLKRASKCANVIGDALGWEVVTSPTLREVDFGEFSGRCIQDVLSDRKIEVALDFLTPSFRWKGGESFQEAYARARLAIRRALRDFESRDIVVVSHGIIIQLLISGILFETPRFAGRFVVSAGSVSCIEFALGKPPVLCFSNWMSRLKEQI